MSFAGKNDVGDGDIDPPAISASPPRPGQSESAGSHANEGGNPSPPRLRNLSRLLLRENVEFVLVVGNAKTVRVSAALASGGSDAKTWDGGDGGCLVLLRLSDNPEGVGGGFFEVRLESDDHD